MDALAVPATRARSLDASSPSLNRRGAAAELCEETGLRADEPCHLGQFYTAYGFWIFDSHTLAAYALLQLSG